MRRPRLERAACARLSRRSQPRREAPPSSRDRADVHQVNTLLRAQSAYFAAGEPAGAQPRVRPPASPTLTLGRLELLRWFAKPPKGPLVCAVHLERRVVHWWCVLTLRSLRRGCGRVARCDP